MNYLKSLLIALAFMMITNLHAQDLSKHQWKDRLVLILVQDTSLPLFQKQLAAFQAEAAGMKERKLLVYQITPTQYKTELTSDNQWIDAKDLFKKFHKTDNNFQIILIGLDGGIKLSQTELLTTEDLFAIIDGMPMRRAELRKRRQ